MSECAYTHCTRRFVGGRQPNQRYCSETCQRNAARYRKRASSREALRVDCEVCGRTVPQHRRPGRRRLYHPECLEQARHKWNVANRASNRVALDLTLHLVTEVITGEMTGPYARALRNDPCAYCGASGGVLDHVVPSVVIGHRRREWDNMTGACADCNAGKKHHDLLTALVLLQIRASLKPLRMEWQRWTGATARIA